MLKLKGQTGSGEWVEFYLSDIETILVRTTWFGDGSIRSIDPATIQPAEDPRKAMLDKIRKRVYKYSYADWHRMLMEILDEMEAKL